MSEEIIEKLHAVELFKDLHPKHLKRVTKLIELRVAKAEEEIVHEGSFSGDLFLVFRGSASVTVRGKRRATLGPGDFFGELSLLHRSPSATVRALDEMELGAIDAKEFLSLLESEPSVALHMLQILILRLEDVTHRPVGELI